MNWRLFSILPLLSACSDEPGARKAQGITQGTGGRGTAGQGTAGALQDAGAMGPSAGGRSGTDSSAEVRSVPITEHPRVLDDAGADVRDAAPEAAPFPWDGSN